MEFKEGSILVTKGGEYKIKGMMNMYNPFNLKPILCFVVDDNGTDRRITEKDVISVKNNHIENVIEP